MKKAVVVRGVYIRGKAFPEGAVGTVGTDKQPGDAFVLSHQEFDELRVSNYVAPHVVAAPVVVPEPVVVEPVRIEKGK